MFGIVFSLLAAPFADAKRMNRFRGSSITQFDKLKQTVQKRRATSAQRRTISRRRNIYRKAMPTVSKRSLKRSTTRGQRKGGTFKNRKRVAAKSESRIRTALAAMTAGAVPFYISVPKGFEKTSDSLNWSSGKLILENGNSSIEVTASAEACEGSFSSSQRCLNEKAEDYGDMLQKEFPSFEVQQSKNMFLRASKVEANKKSPAKLLILQNNLEKVGLLTFLEPTNKFVWQMKITAPNEKNNILNDNRTLQQVIYSLFQKPKTATTPKRKTISRAAKKSTRSNFYKRRKTSRLSRNTSQKVKADNIGFEIKVPGEFKKVSDTMMYNSGEMLLRSDDSVITITPTDEKCQFQTYSLILKCVSEKSDMYENEVTSNISSPRVVQDETLLSQMTFETKVNKDVGHFFLVRSGNRERIALFTFKDPINDYLWKIKVEAPENRRGILNDIGKIRRVITSIFFREE